MAKYDVFVSHAHADKESIATEQQASFKKLGISVFYDTDSILPMRQLLQNNRLHYLTVLFLINFLKTTVMNLIYGLNL